MLEEQLLDANRHDRHQFSCAVAALDDYLHRYAFQQAKKGVSVVRVLVEAGLPSKILGYYSLSAAQVGVNLLSEKERKNLPRYPVPCFRLGRLAIASAEKGKGLGRLLLGLAVDRCLLAKENVGAYALLVDAKDSSAVKFYQYYGFILCSQNVLYLPL